jgi:Protein of unknown function (DUF3617)
MNTRIIVLLLSGCALCHGASADDLPARKAGLWQLTRSPPRPEYPPTVQKICLDAATDALLYKAGTAWGRQACSKLDIHRSGSAVEVNSVCKMGASQATTRDVTTLSGDSAYHEDIAVHFDPPVGKTSDSTTKQDAKWIGACPADMKPGDIVIEPSSMMPVPMRMSIRDMLNDVK